MIAANQITSNTTTADLASFLKFAPPGQFQLLNLAQVETLELAIEDAYVNHVPNQRQRTIVQQMLDKRKKQLNKNSEIKKETAKIILQELANLKKWKYVFVIALFPLFAFIFGGLILGRDTTEATGNIVPFSNITSFEYLTANNFSSIGKLSAINIKTHTQSVTGFGVLAGCLGIGLIIIVTVWAFACCCCRGQIQQDEEYYKLQLSKIENEMN